MRHNLLFFLLLFALACGSDATDQTDEAEDQAAEETTADVPAPDAITISPMPATKSYPGAAITGMTYENNTFNFEYDGGADGYELAQQTSDATQLMCANSDKGQHIHLIVNDEPYAAKYESTFEYELPDGDHYMLAFLGRSYHESIKEPAAAKAMAVTIADGAITASSEIDQPMLFYSRPKGNYAGEDAERVMLDFYPINAELGEDYQVKVEVGGQKFTVNEWRPYFLEGLPVGDHTVTLTLLDANGQVVDAPLNPVSRDITIGM
ncbi:MAG: phosphopeptide-binding protein [Bacteroidota bacterium]